MAQTDSLSERQNASAAIDPFGLAILIFAGLNLNGMIYLLTGAKSVLSPAVLPVVLVLLYRSWRPAVVTDVLLMFCAFMGAYLVLGAFSDIWAEALGRTLQTYTITLLLVIAVASWFAVLPDRGVSKGLRAFKWICFLASVVTAVSPAIYDALGSAGSIDRYSGLFENPDEAAMIALYCLVLILIYPSRSRLINLVQLIVVAIALALTFSKNGVLIAIAVTVFLSFRRGSAAFSACVFAIWCSIASFIWIVYDQDLFDLTREQRQRLGELFGVLGGQIDSQTTTGRTLLLDFGMQKLAKVFPGGAGLGEFHALEGGYRNPLGEWLGIHNTYLMVLGEAGLVPFLLLLALAFRLMYLGWFRSSYGAVVVGFGIVLFGDMIATHNALVLRFSDVVLGIMIALAARTLPPERSRDGAPAFRRHPGAGETYAEP
ncbi:hypothetical protein [Alsobacter sp. SYSU BS001988]